MTAASYPPALPLTPFAHPVRGRVRVPGSKSITNRALVLAALTDGANPVEVARPLSSEDTDVMTDSLRRLGFTVTAAAEAVTVARPATERIIPAADADLFVANSGTSMRFLTAMAALGEGRYRLDGVARMRQRPIADLLDALRQLGVDARSERGDGCPPVVLDARGLAGGPVRVRGDVSSQFLSGLLMAAPRARGDVTVEVEGPLVSVPYVTMTLAMLRAFGAAVTEDGSRYVIPGRQRYRMTRYVVEPDASAASYFYAAAAVTGGTITVDGLGPGSLQGDVGFVDVLEAMGCRVRREAGAVTVEGGPLRGVEADMNAISDTVMTLAAVACFAEGPTTVRNVAHIRHKETDRIAALAAELRRLGAGVTEFADGLRIEPAPLRGAAVETYNDHRMAMSLALVGLRVPGVVITNPACVAKTYPAFFADLERLRT